MSARVVVADDQPLLRAGLGGIISTAPDLSLVGEAATGREAVEQVRQLRPDVVLMDIRMPDLNGIEATEMITASSQARVLMLTTFDLDEYVYGALKAGARGFLLKDAGPELLLQAVQAAATGEALIAPNITARLLTAFADTRTARPPAQPIDPLTPREEEVLITVARGLTNAEIADELHISLSTVKTHLTSLMGKLGARNRVEIAIWAYETKRITP